MSEEVGVTNADTEGAMPGLEVPNWCEGCAGCQALRKELQDKEAEHKRVWLAVKQRVISTEHCETLQMQLDSALKEMEPLKKRNRELEESQQKCRTEVEEARDRIRASEGLCQQYREVIKKFEDEEAAREANNSSEKKVSVAKLQEDLAKLKADLTSEKRKSRGLERELDRAKVMIDGLQEQNSRVQQEAGEPACIPVVTPAKQPRTSHVTRTRTPKQKAPPPASEMSCSNETSDEEEVEWSTVPNRGVLSPVRLLSPLSPLPPTPAPCRRDDRFSSSSDSSDDNSDMDDDADRIESELLGGTQSLPFSDTDIADEKANEPLKLSPVKSNYHNGIHRPPGLKQSSAVNVSKENGKAQVKRFPRDCVNRSSPQKLTRSQDRRGQKRPPLRKAAKAKAAPMEEEITPPIESTKAAVENDCRSWFGEVEDLSDSESDSCLEKEKDREIKAKNGGEDFASPPRMARLCSSATTESDNDTTEEKRKTRATSRMPISPPKMRKTTEATPSRSQYELRSRQDNKADKVDDRIEAENAENKTNVVNKSNDTLQEQTATTDSHEKEEKPVDSRKLSNSLTEEESDKDEAVKPQSQEETKMSSGFDEVCNNPVENNTTDSESNSKISSPPHVDLPAAPSVNKDPSNNTKPESDQEGTEKSRPDSPEFRRPLTRSLSHGGKVNSGSRRDSSSSEREGDVSPKRVARLKTKLVSPVAGPSLRTHSRSSSSEKSLSDIDMKDKPRNSNTPKRVTRLQTKLISPVAGPSSRTRNRSSSSEKSPSDVDRKDNPPNSSPPKRPARLQSKSLAGPSSRTRSRSLSSEKSLSDVDTKDNPPNSNTPKRVTRLQTKLISPVAVPSSRTRNRSSSSEKSLSDVDTKDNPPTKKATRLQTKLISPVAGPSSRTRNRSSSSEKSPSDVDTKDNPPNSNPPKRAARLQSKSLAGPSSTTRSRSLSSEKSLSDVDTKDNPPNSNTPKRVTRLQTKLISPLAGPSSRTRKRSLSSEKVLSDVDTKDNSPKVGTPRRSKRESNKASSSSSEKMTNRDAEENAPKSVSSPKKSAKHLRTEDTSGDIHLEVNVHQEVVTKADELPDGARQRSANDGSNQEAPREEESAGDTMEEGELSESETDTTDIVEGVQGSVLAAQEPQGPTELCIRQQPGVSLPERESPQVCNRSNRSSLSTSPVSPLPPSPFESLALSPLPVSPLLLERPISPLPPSPWGRSASPSLSPSLPISPLRETPLPPVVSPLQRTPHGEDGMSQSISSKDAASPNAENPAHPSPCVFRSVAPKGAVQVKPKANRGRGAARSLSMGGKDAPSQNPLTNSGKKRAILFVQSEKTAWRSGKKNTQAAQDKQKSTTKANSRPTTLPIKPNSKQHPKTKPGKGSNAQSGPEKVNEGATCSQNGHAIAEETTTTPEESTRQTVKQTEKGKIKKVQSLTLEDEDKDKQTSEMSRLKEVDPHERTEEGKTKESSQVPDSETLSAEEDATLPKEVYCVGGNSKRSLEEDVEDGEITGDESDEVVERRAVKKLRTEPRDKLTADHVLQYMNNMQGGATTGGAVDIIMEYLLQSEEARVDLFPKVKTMCVTHNTKLPVMTTAEMAILGRVTYLAKFGQWEGLVSQVSRALYTEIRLNIRKEHLLATCRLYTGLCRLRGQLEQVRILVYDILREKLFFPVDRILTIVSVWPLVLQRSGSNLEDGPMSHVIELVVMSQDIAEDLKSCFRSLYQWKDVKDGDVNSMADRLVKLLQRKETAALVNNTHRVKYPRLNPLMYETAKALELLGSHQGWKWTHDHLIQTLLLPLLQKWRDNKKAKSIKSTVPQGTVVAIMQVIGCVGRIGLAEDKSSVNQLQQVMIDLLNEAVKKQNSAVAWQPWPRPVCSANMDKPTKAHAVCLSTPPSEKCGNPGKLLQMRCWTGPLALEGV
ncbi:snRNA transcription by RNA polymerase III [Branchiostoma belcheri]|nr:snRNA transcription by RNA polymerase III [Branchiostoma belcheri]